MLLVSTTVKDKIFGRASETTVYIFLKLQECSGGTERVSLNFLTQTIKKSPMGWDHLEQKELIVDRSFMNRW